MSHRLAEAEAAIQDGGAPVLVAVLRTKVGVHYLATEPLSVTDSRGDVSPLHFHPALLDADDLESVYDAFGLTGNGTGSLELRFVLPAPDDVVAMESGWHGFVAARVDIALLWPGQDYGSRMPIMEGGRVVALEAGVAGQPSRIVAEASGPPAGASSVDGTRDLAQESTTFSNDGRQYPIVVGRCYKVPAYKVGVRSYTGGMSSVILMGRHAAPNVTATTLDWYEDGGTPAPAVTETLYNTTSDEDGLPIFAVNGGGATTPFGTGDGAYTVDFTQGGVPAYRNPGRSAVGGADVVEFLLAESGADIDWSAMERTLVLLRDWEIGVYLDREMDNLRVLRERVMRFLPLQERQGPRGMYLDYIDPVVAPRRFDLVVGQELLDNNAAVAFTDMDEVRNAFLVEYAYDHATATYTKRVRLGGSTDIERPDERCRYSLQIFGARMADPLQCNITWDNATARRMAHWQALRVALPRRLVSYDVDPWSYWLREGDVGTLTDEARALTRALAVVRTWRPAGRPWRATFEIIDRPPVSRI